MSSVNTSRKRIPFWCQCSLRDLNSHQPPPAQHGRRAPGACPCHLPSPPAMGQSQPHPAVQHHPIIAFPQQLLLPSCHQGQGQPSPGHDTLTLQTFTPNWGRTHPALSLSSLDVQRRITWAFTIWALSAAVVPGEITSFIPLTIPWLFI